MISGGHSREEGKSPEAILSGEKNPEGCHDGGQSRSVAMDQRSCRMSRAGERGLVLGGDRRVRRIIKI